MKTENKQKRFTIFANEPKLVKKWNMDAQKESKLLPFNPIKTIPARGYNPALQDLIEVKIDLITRHMKNLFAKAKVPETHKSYELGGKARLMDLLNSDQPFFKIITDIKNGLVLLPNPELESYVKPEKIDVLNSTLMMYIRNYKLDNKDEYKYYNQAMKMLNFIINKTNLVMPEKQRLPLLPMADEFAPVEIVQSNSYPKIGVDITEEMEKARTRPKRRKRTQTTREETKNPLFSSNQNTTSDLFGAPRKQDGFGSTMESDSLFGPSDLFGSSKQKLKTKTFVNEDGFEFETPVSSGGGLFDNNGFSSGGGLFDNNGFGSGGGMFDNNGFGSGGGMFDNNGFSSGGGMFDNNGFSSGGGLFDNNGFGSGGGLFDNSGFSSGGGLFDNNGFGGF